jgi:signal transduction histidine kinase
MKTEPQSSWFRYGVALTSVALALSSAPLLAHLEPAPFMAFLAAVMVSAWYGGSAPGLLATGLSFLSLDFFFLPPVFSLGTGLIDGIRLGMFSLLAFIVSSLPSILRSPANERRGSMFGKELPFAVLAHEVRGPLAAILNAVTVLRLKSTDTGTVGWASDMVERQARSIAARVEDLLDVSRIAQGKVKLHVKQVDLSTVVQHAVETTRPLIESRKHALEVVLPQEAIRLDADPDRVEQVLVNLLTNAAKYTDPGARIRLQLESCHREAVLRVRDSGIGIESAFLPHIFDLFCQESNGARGGLGLGLSLARSLVRLHGGTITAGSKGSGTGSEFVVRLPLART